MSLSTIHPTKDIVHTRTSAYRPKYRDLSHNLHTFDIEGK